MVGDAALPPPEVAGGIVAEWVVRMNVQADPKTLALGQNAQSTTTGGKGPVLRLTAPEGGAHGGAVQVPSAALLTGGDYLRVGLDLLITGPDGQQVLIEDYFLTDSPPDLTSPDGAQIAGDLAERLAGSLAPGQLAQAGAGGVAKQAIGHVETANGSVTVVHADGTKGILHKGDPIFQGDVLQTAKGAAVGLLFVDNTAMSLGSDGRMVLDSMVFDPASGTGKSAFSLVQGTFSFVSGQIAKAAPDAMMVRTPVATIGIRGTVGSAGYTPEQGLTAGLYAEGANGSGAGEIIISNQGGTITLNQPNLVTQVMTYFTQPPPPVPVNSIQVQIYFGQSLVVLTAPANNPDALRAVLNLQQDAKSQGFDPGLKASQSDNGVKGEAEIKVRQVVSNEQIAKDMLVQATVINALIESGQPIDAAQGSGSGARTGIEKDNRPLDEIAKDLKSGIGAFIDEGVGRGQDGKGEAIVRVVWDNGNNDDGQDKAIQNLIDDIRERAEQNRAFNERLQDIIDRIQELFENVVNNDDDNDLIDAADDTTVFADTLTAASATATLIGGTGNTNFIFDYSTFSSEGWSTYALDTGSTSEDRLTFTNLLDVVLTVKKDTTFPNARVVGTLYEGLSSHNTGGTIDLLGSTWTSTGDVTISTAIDDLQASSGGLSEGKILTNAMANIPGTTDVGYIVAGTSSGETIDLSPSGNFANPMGSIIFGLGGIDYITGTAAKDIIYGGADGDQITGGQGTDVLYGEAGNDTIIGGMGIDSIDGGDGTDLAKYADTSFAIYANIGTGTVVQTTLGTDVITSIEWIWGSSGDDTLVGGSGNDTLWGDAGNDTISGMNGNDVLKGEGGTGDWLSYADETGGSGAQIDLGNNLAIDTWGNSDTILTFENIIGSSYNDTLTGDANANTIAGMNGADVLDGGAGAGNCLSYANETGGSGAVVNLATSSATDTWGNSDTISNFVNIIGSSYNDSLTGDTNANTFIGGAGNDQIVGGGGGGLDKLDYSSNTAAIYANFDSTTHSSVAATTVSSTASGTDTFSGIAHIVGSDYADYFWGSSSANSITGGKGNDVIDLVSADTQGDQIFFIGGDTSQTLGTVARVSTLGKDTITSFEVSYDGCYISESVFGLGNTGSANLYTNSGNGYADLNTAITALATSSNAAGLFIVGTNSAGNPVDVYFLEANASSSANSYQIATITTTDGALTASDFQLTA